MKLLFLLLSLLFFTIVNSQNSIEIKITKSSKRTVSNIEVSGTFPNGDTAMRSIIKEKFNGKVFKQAKKGIYIVKVLYIVDKNGGISDVRCETDPGFRMCEESVKAVRGSSRPVPGPVRVRNKP